jgi:hypothetical protein
MHATRALLHKSRVSDQNSQVSSAPGDSSPRYLATCYLLYHANHLAHTTTLARV